MSASSLALALPAVVRCALVHLRGLHLDPDTHASLRARDAYPALCTAALVCSAWREVAQSLLQRTLVFTGGDRQLVKWREAAPKGQVNKVVTVHDMLPYKEGGRWSNKVLEEVLGAVQGTEELSISLMAQKELPGELLTGENLADVKFFFLGSPFTAAASPPKFALEHLVLFDGYPALSRDWASTCTLLASSPSRDMLKVLAVDSIPSLDRYLLHLVPFAANLHSLYFPSIRLTPDLWRLFVFATACTTLHDLRLAALRAPFVEILQAFPPTVKHVAIGTVTGAVGAGHPAVSPELAPPEHLDTWAQLCGVVREMDGLKRLDIDVARCLSYQQHAELNEACQEKGVFLFIDHWDHEMTTEEEKELQVLSNASKLKEVHERLHEKLHQAEEKDKPREVRPLAEGETLDQVA